jgi:hypothetical protein
MRQSLSVYEQYVLNQLRRASASTLDAVLTSEPAVRKRLCASAVSTHQRVGQMLTRYAVSKKLILKELRFLECLLKTLTVDCSASTPASSETTADRHQRATKSRERRPANAKLRPC